MNPRPEKPRTETAPAQACFQMSIAAFKAATFLLMFFLVAVIGSKETVNIQAIDQLTREIRQTRLPVFVENQKTLVNIERLRGLAELAKVSNDPLVRRKARMDATALATESIFEHDSNFRDSAGNIARKIKGLASGKDDIAEQQRQLQRIGGQYYTALGDLAALTATAEHAKVLNSLFSSEILAATRGGEFHPGASAGVRSVTVAERHALVEDIVEAAILQKPGEAERLTSLKTSLAAFLDEYEATSRAIAKAEAQTLALWTEIDFELRNMRDTVSTGSEIAIASALDSIEEASAEAYASTVIMYVALFASFLSYYLLVHIFLTKPLRWASVKLTEIQVGNLNIPTPPIYIKEISHIAGLLDRFSVHLADLYSHANQLEEDVAEKRDIEEVMQAVFKASLDGYIVWNLERLEKVSQGAAGLFGFASEAEMSASRRAFGFSPKTLRRIFRKATELGVLREEMSLSALEGRHVPCEVTHLPIFFHGRSCILSYLRDLTEQKKNEEALLLAKEQAEVATKAKSEFLARMSHEIRTPMNGVLGLTHIALESSPAPRQRELLSKIQSSAQLLLGIINDILDFSKMEDDKLELDYSSFSFPRVLSTITDLLTPQAEKKGLAFLVEYNAAQLDSVVLRGDHLRLTQVLLNLCGNAIKFTEKGSVTLSLNAVKGTESSLAVEFRVQDTGIGMTEAQISRLFKPFSQADSSTTRKHGGTGLGLMISKLLVELMGGDITTVSAPGQGSVFSFTLELERLGMAEAADAAPEEQEEAVVAGKRVLVAEDNEINQEIIQSLLEDLGLAVTLVGNGQEALDILEHKDFDCIFLDIQMPFMDGLTAAREIRLRGREGVRHLPIIAMTAHAMQEDTDKSMAAGMNDHLTKPIDVAALNKCVRHYLGSPAG